MTVSSHHVIWASVLAGMTIALVWFRVPVVPAIVGGCGAGLVLYLRARRRMP